MKNILLALLTAWAPMAHAAERVIINPDQDGDLKLKVNQGGTPTDVITAKGSTGNVGIGTATPGAKLDVNGQATLGPSGFTGTHQINGATQITGNATTGTAITAVGTSGTTTTEGLRVIRTSGLPNQSGTINAAGGVFRFVAREDSNFGGYQFNQYNGTTEREGMSISGDGSVHMFAVSSGVGLFVVTAASSATACNTYCILGEPASLGSASGVCLNGWNNSTFAPISNTSTVSACQDTSTITRRCLCLGLN